MAQIPCSQPPVTITTSSSDDFSVGDLPLWRLWGLRIAFGSTALVGILIGNLMLFAAPLSRDILGFPTELPQSDGIVYGILAAIWIAVGIMCIAALFRPLQYLTLLKIQVLYKSIWIAAVAIPLLWKGDFPAYGWTLLIGNLIWISMDMVAIPWRVPPGFSIGTNGNPPPR